MSHPGCVATEWGDIGGGNMSAEQLLFVCPEPGVSAHSPCSGPSPGGKLLSMFGQMRELELSAGKHNPSLSKFFPGCIRFSGSLVKYGVCIR